MSGILGFVPPPGPTGTRQNGTTLTPMTDAPALAAARQALARARERVDADHRAHSPDCVAVDQKGVDKASAELAEAEGAENASITAPIASAPASVANRALSITA